jgi:hypothetical protein
LFSPEIHQATVLRYKGQLPKEINKASPIAIKKMKALDLSK